MSEVLGSLAAVHDHTALRVVRMQWTAYLGRIGGPTCHGGQSLGSYVQGPTASSGGNQQPPKVAATTERGDSTSRNKRLI